MFSVKKVEGDHVYLNVGKVHMVCDQTEFAIYPSDVNRPVRRPGTVGRPNSCQDGRDGASTVRPVQACQ
jgi:hypothetical protein